MQDSRKKSDPPANSPETSFTPEELVVVPYEQVPLDQGDRISRPIIPPRNRVVVPPVSVPNSRTIPWGVDNKDDVKPKSPTIPYTDRLLDPNAKPESTPVASGIRMNTPAPADIMETRENAERISAEISSAARPGRLPDLAGLFSDDDEVAAYVDQSHAFRGLNPLCRNVTQRAVEKTIPTPIPPKLPKQVLSPEQREYYANQPIVQDRLANLPPSPISPPVPAPTPTLAPVTASKSVEKPAVLAPPQFSSSPVAAPSQDGAAHRSHEVVEPAPAPEKPKSLWSRMTGKVGEKLSSARDAVTGFVRKHKAGVAVAAATSLAAATGAGLYMNQSQDTDQQNNTDNTYQTVDTPAPSTSMMEAPAPVQNNTENEPAAPRKFAKVLENSKSPLVQDIINDGKAQLNGNILGNTMLMPFVGLANDAQKAEMGKLQRTINLGMGVFFNEHFGTPDKIAQSMKDPNLRSLYSTAKVMKEKGWAPPSLTKEKYPEAYQLAVKIFEDSRTLGLDTSDNTDPKVQARVNGNMFQAKKNGDTLQLKKSDGSYHVVLEAVFNIFDGKNAQNAVQATNTVPTTVNPTAPAQSPQNTVNESGSNAPQDSISVPINPTTPTPILQNNYMPPDTSDVDDEWENIGNALDQLAAEKKIFEKDLALEVTVAGGLSSRELHKLLIAAVGEKLALLYPMSNREQIVGMVKRFGYIGFHLVHADSGTGKCQVRIYKNFYRILKEILDKKVVKKELFS